MSDKRPAWVEILTLCVSLSSVVAMLYVMDYEFRYALDEEFRNAQYKLSEFRWLWNAKGWQRELYNHHNPLPGFFRLPIDSQVLGFWRRHLGD